MSKSGLPFAGITGPIPGSVTLAAVPSVGARFDALRVLRRVLVTLRTVRLCSVMAGEPFRAVILGVRDDRQVRWVNALSMRALRAACTSLRAMAKMINIGAAGNRGDVHLIREPMRANPLIAHADHAVALIVDLPRPLPAAPSGPVGADRRAEARGGVPVDPLHGQWIAVSAPSVKVLPAVAITGVRAVAGIDATHSLCHPVRILYRPISSRWFT